MEKELQLLSEMQKLYNKLKSMNDDRSIDRVSKLMAEKANNGSTQKSKNSPSTPLYFMLFKSSIDKLYEKNRAYLSVEEFTKYKEEMFQIIKNYKLKLDTTKQEDENEVFAKCAVQLLNLDRKYNIPHNTIWYKYRGVSINACPFD